MSLFRSTPKIMMDGIELNEINLQPNVLVGNTDNTQTVIIVSGTTGSTITQILEPINIFYSSNIVSQEFNSDNETNINILENEIKNDNAYEKINNYELKILKKGTYLIQYKINIDSITNSRLTSLIKLYIDNGLGYQELTDAKSYGYHRQISQGKNTPSNIPRPIILNENSKIKITAIVDDISGNRILTTMDNSCTLYIWKLQEQITENINPSNIPIITTLTPTNTIVKNDLYQYQMLINGVGVTWSLQNEPSGMVINQFSGLITYTPITSGVYNNIIVRATNNDGSDSINFNLTVNNLELPEQDLLCWFDPETVTSNNGSSPSFWIDRTGLYTASQNSGNIKPTYITNIYSKPVFQGNGDEYYDVNIGLNNTFSIFIVANSTNQWRESFLFSGSSNTYFGHDWAQDITLRYNNSNETKINYTNTYINNLTLLHIFRNVNGLINVSINGIETNTFFTQSGNINITSIIGSNNDRYKSHEGYFGDFVVYNQTQTGNNLTQIENFLKSKYGII